MAEFQLQEFVSSERTYEDYETLAATDSAAGYYNLDSIPDTPIFFPPEDLPVASNWTTAKFTLKSKGIYSSDPKLDQNADELWRFLVSHLQSPALFVRIEGTHIKVTDAMDSLHRSVVTDFSVQIDASKYVNPQWSRMVTRAFQKDGAKPTVREILEGYARCRDPSKKFSLMKMVGWKFGELNELLTDLVRFSGYKSKVTITYVVPDHKVVVAHSESAPGEGIASSWLTSGLVWLAGARASASNKRFENRLVCEYAVESSAQDFFGREADRIYDAVRRRCKEKYMVAL